MNILEQIASYARERVRRDKEIICPEEMRELAYERKYSDGRRFERALAKAGRRFICEVKKASPSKGIIDPEFDYMAAAKSYEAAGADAISCLTEPKWFLGSDDIFRAIRKEVATPMLRKDFVVDEYQIYQAKAMGADCVLLICSILDDDRLAEYIGLCGELQLSALVETHDEEEIGRAVAAGGRIIGVNNRNRKDFSVDLHLAEKLRALIPSDRIMVAESGVSMPRDAAMLFEAGADAILVGEALMRASDKGEFLQKMREARLDA